MFEHCVYKTINRVNDIKMRPCHAGKITCAKQLPVN